MYVCMYIKDFRNVKELRITACNGFISAAQEPEQSWGWSFAAKLEAVILHIHTIEILYFI